MGGWPGLGILPTRMLATSPYLGLAAFPLHSPSPQGGVDAGMRLTGSRSPEVEFEA